MRRRKLYFWLVILWLMPAALSGQGGDSDYQYALIEAVKQKNLGNIPGAIELYKMVVTANDSVPVAYFELGSLYAIVNEPDLSEMNMRKAVELDPENEWFVNGLLEILVLQEKYEEAVTLTKKAIDTFDNGVEYRFKRANIYSIWGKYRRAIKELNRIEKNYGLSDKVILLKANIFEKKEDYKSARKEVDKLINAFPESLQFYVVAAELALKTDQKELASKYYSQVLELDSTNIYALTNLTDYYRINNDHEKSLYYLKRSFESDFIEFDRKMAILSYYLGDQYFMENYTDQLESLISVIKLKHPDKKEINLFAVDFYIQKRDYEKAFKQLKPLLNKDQKEYELWRQGILLANALSLNDELLSLSKDAYKRFPDSTEIVYFKGIAEYENKLYDDVVITYSDPVIKKHGNSELVSQIEQLLAESYYRLEMYDISDSLYRKIIQKEPDNYMVINNFSYYLAVRGESLEEARVLSYKTIVENPENGTFLDTYAWVLYKIGEYREAERYINKALQKGGLNDPDVNEHAGEIQEKLKSYHMAKSFYEKAIILGGDRNKLEEKIKQLNINEK